MSEPTLIEVYEDFACPWCFLGRRRLEHAIAEHRTPEAFRVVHRAFQLRSDLPEGGIDIDSYLVPRMGGQANVDKIHARLRSFGEAESIRFDFSPGGRMWNTRLAHRVAAICAKEGAGKEASDALFRGYFEDRAPMDQLQALLSLLVAHDVPVLPGDIERRVHLGEGDAEVDADLATSRELGISGVPFFVANGSLALNGAQELATFSQYLNVARGDSPPA